MKSSVEPTEGNKVKVSVEVDEGEFDRDVDAAFRRIAREVRIPGFRPGKAPRRILEARIGTDAARAEALQHALPEYYAQAVGEHDVDVIAPPEIDITSGEGEGPVAFDAVVEVRPTVVVGGYASLRVTLDRPSASEEEIDARIDHLREQFATLSEVDRPAVDGDSVTIDISGTQDGEALDGLTAEGYQYEVGSASVVAELDDELRGAKVGDILSFTADHPDPEQDRVDFRVLVKEIREKLLPEVGDAFAAEASEFDTVDELRADFARRLSAVKQAQGQMALQEGTGQALADLVDVELPEPLVQAEMQNRVQEMAMRLQAQGLELGQYLQATGQEPDTFRDELRGSAEQAVRVDLALRAVADAEQLEPSDDDLADEIAAVAERVGEKPAKVRTQLERNHQMPAVRSDLRNRKALEWVAERVEIVDLEGAPIDRSEIELSAPGSGEGGPEVIDGHADEPDEADDPDARDDKDA